MIDDDEVSAIARLAKINIDAHDIPTFANDLNRIIEFVSQMNAVDTSDVEPLAHPLELSAPLRTDTVSESNRRESFQQNAPRVDSGLYLVPKVIE